MINTILGNESFHFWARLHCCGRLHLSAQGIAFLVSSPSLLRRSVTNKVMVAKRPFSAEKSGLPDGQRDDAITCSLTTFILDCQGGWE